MVPWRRGPLLRWSEAALTTLEELEPYAGVPVWARVIGEGEVVLDWDDGLPPPAQLPINTTTLRTRRGWHLWFRCTAPLRKGRVALFGRPVDVCPAGTLERVAGEGYEFTSWVDPVPLPALVEAALMPEERGGMLGPGGAGRTVRHQAAYIRACLDNAYTAVSTAPEGRRNSTLYIEAVKLAKVGASWEKTLGTLTRAALRAGLEREEAERTIMSGYAAPPLN